MKVLHVTNWYPNPRNPKESIWIRNVINALPENVESDIIHFEIKTGSFFRKEKFKRENLKQVIFYSPVRFWFMLEFAYFFWLFYQFRIKKIHKRYDIINFHIAYPMLTYWHWIKDSVNKPVVIFEHWSAYHFNFGVKKPLPRIKKIFHQKIPVITVSQALAKDIANFAEAEFPKHVVPNVVDRSIFYSDPEIVRENFLFMVSQWKVPKNPVVAMDAFLEFNIHKRYLLKIAGYGPLWNEMQKWVNKNHAQEWVQLLGPLDSSQIADHMRRCKAFLHPSEYETFSVVCAEARSCGAFVIAPRVGGIPEVVNDFGMLLDASTKTEWVEGLKASVDLPPQKADLEFEFSIERVGDRYVSALKDIINSYDR